MPFTFKTLIELYNLRPSDIRQVKGFSGYYISNTGDIYSIRNNRITKLKIQRKDGRPSITLTLNGKRFKKYIHRLLWESFQNKTIPRGYEIDHINGNPLDNRISNLDLISKAENIRKSTIGRRHSSAVEVILLESKSKKIIKEFPSIKDCNKYFIDNKIPFQANLLLNGYSSLKKFNDYGYDLIRKKKESNIRKFENALSKPIVAIQKCFNLKVDTEIREHPFTKSSIAKYYGDSTGMIYKVKKNTVEQKNVQSSRSGYIQVSINGVNHRAHRFIYECFRDIRLNKNTFVDHIDSNRTNNAFSNLRLSNPKHNSQAAHNKKTFVYYFKGRFIDSFKSVKNTAEFIETKQSNISSNISGKSFILKNKYFVTIEAVENPKDYFTKIYLERYEKIGYKVLWKWAKYEPRFGYIEREFDKIMEVTELYGDIDSSLEAHLKGKYKTCLNSLWLAVPPTIDFPEFHPESKKYSSSFNEHEYLKLIYEIQNRNYNKKLPATMFTR